MKWHFVAVHLLVATFYVPSAAAPSGSVTSFTVLEGTTDGLLLSGRDMVKKAYLKYGSVDKSSLVARATPTGTVTATPTDGDSTYLIPVAVGSSGTKYTMSVDTSSSEFSLYAPKLGSSGSVTTTVNIGGIAVSKQVVSLNTDSTGGSNLVGLSYSGNDFYTNAVSMDGMAPVFTADLKKGAPGKYNFGFVDTTAYTGNITYVTVDTTNGFWQCAGNGYAIGSGAFTSLSINAVVDTGTTVLFLPQSLVAAYYQQVKGAAYSSSYGGYVFPCTAQLPNLVVGISSYKATVPGSYLNYAPVSSDGATCYGGLQSDSGIGFSILGLVFIKSQFVVFKGTTTPTLGFAAKKL